MKSSMQSRIFRALSPPGLSTRLAVAVALAGLVSACDVHSPTAPGTLASITVTPDVTLAISATQQFVAVGRDAEGAVISISPIWSIVGVGGTINASTGMYTAGMVPGTYAGTVKAASGSIAGTASVIVTVGALATITVTPNPDTLPANDVQQFTAVGRDGGGNVLSISPAWSVVASGGSINSASGLFTAGSAAGTYTNTVEARNGSVAGFATVVVTASAPPPPLVPLGQAAFNGILAGTTFTCITGGLIKADVGVWPGSANTGFPPCAITGTQHLGDAVSQTAQGDLTTAYNQLAGMPCSPANALTGQDLGGMTLAPGVYCFTSSAFLTGTLTIAGPADGNWVFQIATTLVTGTNSSVVLSGGALASNVYWQVGSSATIAIGTAMQGNILALTSISLKDNATLLGRALARNGGVTLDNNNVITLP